MADTTTPSFAKIGLTVFLGVLAIVGTLIYLGGVRGHEDLCYAETYFTKSVSGLSVGSPVNFRGVKIGEVAEIGFVGDHYRVDGPTNQIVYVRIALPHKQVEGFESESCVGLGAHQTIDTLIRDMGMRATVTASGITGLSRIELDQQPNVPIMPISWTPRYPYLPPAYSLLDSFSDSATRVMNQINKIDLSTTWSNIAATVQSLAKVTEGAQAMIESRRGDLEKIGSDISAITTSLRELVEEVRENPSLLIRERIAEPLPETAREK